MAQSISRHPKFKKHFMQWWSTVSGVHADPKQAGDAHDRGARAELRRAENALEVCMTEAFGIVFLGSLRRADLVPTEDEVDKLARLAGLSAHVKDFVDKSSMGRILAGPRNEGTRAAMSPIRFRKLMSIEDEDALFLALVRTLRMTDGKAHFESLARACFRWNNETRRWWALEYYDALPEDQSEYTRKKK